jgi:hypothetical protein
MTCKISLNFIILGFGKMTAEEESKGREVANTRGRMKRGEETRRKKGMHFPSSWNLCC